MTLEGHQVVATVSIGVALGTVAHARAEDLLRDADTALDRAKALGRARYEVFDQDMHVREVAQLALEMELRQGLVCDQFRVRYQPLVRSCALRYGESPETTEELMQAGYVGLLKAILALQHKVLPPTIKVDRPNPGLDLETSALYLNTVARVMRSPSHLEQLGCGEAVETVGETRVERHVQLFGECQCFFG